MSSINLKEMLQQNGLVVEEIKSGVFKGNSCNIVSYPTFRAWINKSGKVTIKTRGIQKSFKIENTEQFTKILKGFEIR